MNWLRGETVRNMQIRKRGLGMTVVTYMRNDLIQVMETINDEQISGSLNHLFVGILWEPMGASATEMFIIARGGVGVLWIG